MAEAGRRHPLRWAFKALFGLLFVLAGLNHFRNPDFYIRIMPPYLPWHRELVFLSGVAEVALGLMLFVPRAERIAGWGLICLLLAVFPANLHMALHPEQFPQLPYWMLLLRLPIQGLLIAWAYVYARGRFLIKQTTSA